MYLLLAIASLFAQATGFLACGFLVHDLFSIPGVVVDQTTADQELVQRLLMETLVSYGPWLGTGFAGVIVAWLLILKDGYRANWYLKTTRVFAWVWFPLFPVGTVLAIMVFSARAAVSGESQR